MGRTRYSSCIFAMLFLISRLIWNQWILKPSALKCVLMVCVVGTLFIQWFMTEWKSFPLHIDPSLMARQNPHQQQPSPTPSGEQSPKGSQNAPEHGNVEIPGNHASQTSRRRHHASQQSAGEVVDITLSDKTPLYPPRWTLRLPPLCPPRPITLS